VISLDVRGGEELYQALRQLPIDLQAAELGKALKAAGNTVADEMAIQAPREHSIGPRERGHEHLADSIVVVEERKPIDSAAEVYVGPNKNTGWRARFIEFGAAVHAIVKKRKKVLASPDQVFGTHVDHPGVKPVPFMRRALDVSGPEAIKVFREQLAQGIKRVAAKLSRQWAPRRKPKDYAE
jgi:HK97 gp10 family phage protein